jgi:hypothetical protein
MPLLLNMRRKISQLIDQAAADRDAEIKRLKGSLAERELQCEKRETEAVQGQLERKRLEHELADVRATAARDRERLTAEASSARHEHEKAVRALQVAEEENRRLWALCQRDQARVAKERALFDRARAEAETVAVGGSD